MAKRPKPIVLTVLDGWGYSPEMKGNAIALARKPNYDRLLTEFPNILINTSGPLVGLPEGQMGNSEVGHLNIGAGRMVQMDITRIDAKIATGALFENTLLLEAMKRGRERQLHLMGLVSDGGVHSHSSICSRCCAWRGRIRSSACSFMHFSTVATRRRIRHRLSAALQQKMRELGVGRDRFSFRALLRDGSRQPLGARRARLPRPCTANPRSATIRLKPCGELRTGRDGRIYRSRGDHAASGPGQTVSASYATRMRWCSSTSARTAPGK